MTRESNVIKNDINNYNAKCENLAVLVLRVEQQPQQLAVPF